VKCDVLLMVAKIVGSQYRANAPTGGAEGERKLTIPIRCEQRHPRPFRVLVLYLHKKFQIAHSLSARYAPEIRLPGYYCSWRFPELWIPRPIIAVDIGYAMSRGTWYH